MAIKLLIVDDSIFMRKTLTKILSTDDIEVVGTAANGREGVEMVMDLNPDIVTMDVEMPVMNGLDALKKIMKHHPVPVLMLSTLTAEGANATMEALTHGAVDFVTKKAAFKEMYGLQDELITKIKNIVKNSDIRNQLQRQRLLAMQSKAGKKKTEEEKLALRIGKKLEERKRQKQFKIDSRSRKSRPRPQDIEIIAIGISTGGPIALQKMVKDLPGELPVPIVIAQHMPAHFTASLAKRLDNLGALNVSEGEDGARVKPGHIYLAPGGRQMTINRHMRLSVSDEYKNEIYKPSVNILVNSVVQSFGGRAVGIIMTGMGRDGFESLAKLHQAGGYIIAQDEDSCIVPGMPRAVIHGGIADEVYSLENLASAITSLFNIK
jgi:two-component system chemotaxis response regulator CheB